MAREELGRFGGIAALIATLTIMLIIVAILAMVVVNSLAASSWGVWSVGLTIPIALLMGFYLRYLRPGKVFEVSIIGIVLLVLAIASGGLDREHCRCQCSPLEQAVFGLGHHHLRIHRRSTPRMDAAGSP